MTGVMPRSTLLRARQGEVEGDVWDLRPNGDIFPTIVDSTYIGTRAVTITESRA